MSNKTSWSGVFPAITTQMHKDGSINLDATAKHVEALIGSGVAGIIFLGSLGENQTLLADEKRLLMSEMIKVVAGRIPVLSGNAETTPAQAIRYAKDLQKMGADGYMLMPSMLYKGDERERVAYFKSVAKSTDLPVMIYNNPLSYANDLTCSLLNELASVEQFVSIKESCGDVRRITAIHNEVGGRYKIFTGVDNLALEASILGIDGWVAGTGIAFPAQNQYLWDLTRAGKWNEAREIYRWFTPLLDLDVSTKFVQYIKLAVQETGLGSEFVRAPRLTLAGAERKQVLETIHTGIKNAPKVPAKYYGKNAVKKGK